MLTGLTRLNQAVNTKSTLMAKDIDVTSQDHSAAALRSQQASTGGPLVREIDIIIRQDTNAFWYLWTVALRAKSRQLLQGPNLMRESFGTPHLHSPAGLALS